MAGQILHERIVVLAREGTDCETDIRQMSVGGDLPYARPHGAAPAISALSRRALRLCTLLASEVSGT